MNYALLIIPFVAAFVGWCVVKITLAIMIKHATARKEQLAHSLGDLITGNLFSIDALAGKITSPDNLQKIMPLIDEHIDHFLKVKLKKSMPVVGMFVGEKTIAQLKAVFLEELESLFPLIMTNYVQQLQSEVDIKKMIVEKVSSIPADEMKATLNSVLNSQRGYIETAGAIMGFVIGVITVLLTFLIV